MTKKYLLLVSLFCIFFPAGTGVVAAGQNDSPLHVNVFLVQLNIAVTDRKGNYVTGLHPEDFAIYEDKTIAETIVTENWR